MVNDGAVLLLSAHEPDDTSTRFWFTPGGGVFPGETPRAAAVREAREETGVTLDPNDLVGPVAVWVNAFTFAGRPLTQRNVYFLYAGVPATGPTQLTAEERGWVEQARWIAIDQVADLAEPVYPPDLASLVAGLQQWEGTVIELGADD